MGAFQGAKGADNDPVAEPATMGATIKGDGSVIYLEVIRDESADKSFNAAALEKQVVVHEVGHQFSHPNQWHAADGIMKGELSGDPADEFFDEETQELFRKTTKVN